jgi:hypothetical protein
MGTQEGIFSRLWLALFLVVGGFALTLAVSGNGPAQPATNPSSLLFVENEGQFDEAVRFRLDGDDRTLWLTEDGLWLSLLEPTTQQGVHLKLIFVGANSRPQLQPFEPRPTRFSYFMSNDPAGWYSGVATWGGVRYVELYPGIDLELAGENGRFTPRLICRDDCREGLPLVALQIEGAEAIGVEEGQLRLQTAVGEVMLPLFRVEGGEGFDFSPQVDGNRVVMPFGGALPVVAKGMAIPADEPDDLLYGTFLGGSASDHVRALTRDGAGATYLTGQSSSVDFPTTAGAFVVGGDDSFVFLAKLNSAGSDLDYAAFLGGNDTDYSRAIAVDSNGAAYLTGLTGSTNFPTTFNAYDRTFNGGTHDSFVAKIEPGGTILAYSTFLGGNAAEFSEGIAVDGNGVAYTAGTTTSTNFPITNGGSPLPANGYVTKISSNGENLIFSTLLGGSSTDEIQDLVLGEDGSFYVTGMTHSLDFPVSPDAFDPVGDEAADGFLARFAGNHSLAYATFFGGSDQEWSFGMALGENGTVYMTGQTTSSDFPVTDGAFDTSHNGGLDGFVLKVSEPANDIVFGTFLGGSAYELPFEVDVAADGSVYVTGIVQSADFPTTVGGFDTSLNGSEDAFLVQLDGSGSMLLYGTFIGGDTPDGDAAVAVIAEAGGVVYVGGLTAAANFPTTQNGFDTILDGPSDGFLVKLATGDNSTATPTATHMATDTATAGPTETPTPSATAGTAEITPTATEAATTNTPTPTFTPLPTVNPTPTASSTPTPTATVPTMNAYWLYLPGVITNP